MEAVVIPKQVGGALRYQVQDWMNITDSSWVLQAVQGYKLDFTSVPPHKPPSLTADLPLKQDQALSKEIQSLVQKAAIIRTLKTDGFFSPIFIVPKKDGGWRSVLNLKALNRYIHTPHFKMEGIASVKDVLQSGDYMGKLDLKDAYLSIPISEQHRKYLRFQWKKMNYEFQTLPFGLASAPRVFTKILRPVAATMRKKGI